MTTMVLFSTITPSLATSTCVYLLPLVLTISLIFRCFILSRAFSRVAAAAATAARSFLSLSLSRLFSLLSSHLSFCLNYYTLKRMVNFLCFVGFVKSPEDCEKGVRAGARRCGYLPQQSRKGTQGTGWFSF